MDEYDVSSIDAWYDRHTRSYVIQLKDKKGYQVGNAIYVGNKTDRDIVVKDLMAEYGLPRKGDRKWEN